MTDVAIIQADARHIPLADVTVQCVVTSPPYWGLRKYAGAQDLIWNGWRGAFGLEPTIEMYVEHTLEILREIRRVLRVDGVVFWNLGDSYAHSGCSDVSEVGGFQGAQFRRDPEAARQQSQSRKVLTNGVKPKDLCLIPERVAIAAQSDGWWVRSMIIWAKPNPMPESCKDRPTDAYEHIIMLTKSARYYWDGDAVAEKALQPEGDARLTGQHKAAHIQSLDNSRLGTNRGAHTRNLRNVWTFPTQPYKGAHFATFPEEIPRRCILAATSERGCCEKCGAPWERVTEKRTHFESGSGKAGNPPNGKHAGSEQAESGDYDIRMGPVNEVTTLGWEPGCECDAPTKPCLVLDPFAGSGTTGRVAVELNRRSVLLDLAYHDHAETRTRNVQRKLVTV